MGEDIDSKYQNLFIGFVDCAEYNPENAGQASPQFWIAGKNNELCTGFLSYYGKGLCVVDFEKINEQASLAPQYAAQKIVYCDKTNSVWINGETNIGPEQGFTFGSEDVEIDDDTRFIMSGSALAIAIAGGFFG